MNNTLSYIIERFNPILVKSGGSEIRNVNRTIVAGVLGELRFKEGAEIGVAEGYHAKVLCENVPGLTLHCVDVWAKYPGYSEYENIETVYSEAKDRLKSYDCRFVKKFSMDAIGDFADKSLDFVYIDGAHDFKSVADDVCEWSKKVKIGGIVFGHDFKRSKRNIVDVKDIIPAFCYAKKVDPWFILTNDMKDPHFGPDNPGWMFVRLSEQKI